MLISLDTVASVWPAAHDPSPEMRGPQPARGRFEGSVREE